MPCHPHLPISAAAFLLDKYRNRKFQLTSSIPMYFKQGIYFSICHQKAFTPVRGFHFSSLSLTRPMRTAMCQDIC